MKNIALMSKDDKTVLFTQTAAKMKIHPSIVEKDFWVCFLLDHLFHDCKYKDMFVFKGGTSLSKSYHVIERFSEDIDLMLDWRKIISDESNPWEDRTKTKQDTFNKQINKAAAEFYKEELVPMLNNELSLKLGDGEWVAVDSFDEMVVNFMYPKDFALEYIVPVVRLEIGPLAEWMPFHKSAHYETATLKTVNLIPTKEIIQSLKNDYAAMANMFYGKAPEFDDILIFLSKLENEIHNL